MFGYYLNLALRSLKRNRALTALMVLAIAVGIGASMTTLTVMHLLSGDPLPGRSSTASIRRWIRPTAPPTAGRGHAGLPVGGGPVECASRRSPGADCRSPSR